MAQRALPGFQVGDRAFLSDGRSGLVTASRFDTVAGAWEHLLDGIFEFFFESDLSSEPPIVEEEFEAPPPVPEPSPVVVVEAVAAVTQADLDALTRTIINAANLTAQANLQAHIEDVEAARDALSLLMEIQFSQLESTVTTTLSEIEKRSTDLETAAEESSGSGFRGFIGGLGGLISNPVEWIMSRLGDHILSEVNDGLNR